MKLPAIALLAFAMVAQTAEAKTASFSATCRSFVLDGAAGSTPTQNLDLPFTTWDGAATHPLRQIISGFSVYSGEFQPQGAVGRYVADFVSYANGIEQSFGTVKLTLPNQDSNGNGIQDILEEDQFISTDISGTLVSDQAPAVSVPFDGLLERNPPFTAGAFSMYFNTDQGRVSYIGSVKTLRMEGQADYNRVGLSNSVVLAFSYATYDGSVITLRGTNTFQAGAAGELQLPAWRFVDGNLRVYETTPATLQLSGRKYKGLLQFNDGNLDTSWADFRSWDVVIEDLNDANANGLPDMTDSPVFTENPESHTANENSIATLSVSVLSDPPASLQWYFQNQPIPNATASTLTLFPATKANEGSYYVVASSPVGGARSASATLSINLQPLVTISQPAGQIPKKGVPAVVNAAASDPDGEITSVDFYTSDPPSGVPVLTVSSAPFRAQLLHFTIAPLEVWAVAHDNGGASKESAHIILKYSNSPTFTTDPHDVLVNEGSTTSLSVAVDSDTPATVQWFFKDAILPGATSPNLSLPNATKAIEGPYYAVATNAAGSAKSATGFVTVNLRPAVALTPPREFQVFPVDSPVTLTAEVADPENDPVRVEFYTSDSPAPVATLSAPPYNAPFTHHTLEPVQAWAVAVDSHGAAKESDHITLGFATAPKLVFTSIKGVDGAAITVFGTPGVRHVVERTGGFNAWTPLETNILVLVSNNPPVGAWKYTLPGTVSERSQGMFRAVAR